jgi:hypothetical protein
VTKRIAVHELTFSIVMSGSDTSVEICAWMRTIAFLAPVMRDNYLIRTWSTIFAGEEDPPGIPCCRGKAQRNGGIRVLDSDPHFIVARLAHGRVCAGGAGGTGGTTCTFLCVTAH